MDTTTINSILDVGLKGGLTLTGVITVLVFLYVYKRTKSPHIILARLWLMLNGKKECNDPIIKKFLDEQSDLLQFRFITGIQAKTVAHVATIKTWCDRHGETITAVAACGQYFNINESRPLADDKMPTNKLMAFFALIVTVLTVAAMLALTGVVYDRALLRMNATGTWFGINDHSAKPIGSAPGFLLSECKDVIAKGDHPGFKASDVAFICNWSQEQGTNTYLAKTISGQRTLCAFVALFLALASWRNYRKMLQASEAIALRKRIAEHTRVLS